MEAEAQPDVSESFDIDSVPSFVLLRGHTLLSRISGANASALNAAVATHAASSSRAGAAGAAAGALSSTTAAPGAAPSTYTPTSQAQAQPNGAATGTVGEHSMHEDIPEETDEEIEERCKALMKKEKIMLFMKGNPDAPRCGFSQKTVNLLREQKVDFGHYDILEDEGVRQGQ